MKGGGIPWFWPVNKGDQTHTNKMYSLLVKDRQGELAPLILDPMNVKTGGETLETVGFARCCRSLCRLSVGVSAGGCFLPWDKLMTDSALHREGWKKVAAYLLTGVKDQ